MNEKVLNRALYSLLAICLLYFAMDCTTLWAPLLATWTFVTATRALSNSDILQRDNSKANRITQEGAQEGKPQGNRQGNIQLPYRALFNTFIHINMFLINICYSN